MAKPKIIVVKESLSDLKKELKSATNFFVPRLRMLIEMKKHEKSGISKTILSNLIGVNHNSVQNWRTIYEKQGLRALLSHGRIGFKKSVISPKQHEDLKNVLTNPENGLQGYKELKIWFENRYNPIAYTTLVGYCTRHFGTKIKVARKSHVKKDQQAVNSFKKTLVSTLIKP